MIRYSHLAGLFFFLLILQYVQTRRLELHPITIAPNLTSPEVASAQILPSELARLFRKFCRTAGGTLEESRWQCLLRSAPIPDLDTPSLSGGVEIIGADFNSIECGRTFGGASCGETGLVCPVPATKVLYRVSEDKKKRTVRNIFHCN